MEYVINPLYWTLIYNPALFDASKLSTYRGPYCNHFVPWFYLNIEWQMNGFAFNMPSTKHYFIYLTIVYSIVNFVSTMILGYPIYHFLTYSSPKDALIIIGVAVMLFSIYTCLTLINNYLKANDTPASKIKRKTSRLHLE